MLHGAIVAFAVLAVATAAAERPQSAASNSTDDGREGSGRCKSFSEVHAYFCKGQSLPKLG